jgi:hypothetical protein
MASEDLLVDSDDKGTEDHVNVLFGAHYHSNLQELLSFLTSRTLIDRRLPRYFSAKLLIFCRSLFP